MQTSGVESCNPVESRVQAMVLRQQEVVRSLSLPIQVPKVDKNEPVKSSRNSQAWKKPPRPPSSSKKQQQLIDRDFASKLLALETIKASDATRTQRRLEKICKKTKSISPPPRPSPFDYATVASLVFTFVVAALLLFQGFASLYSSRSTTELQEDDINKVSNWTPLVPTSQQHEELYQHLKPPAEESSAPIGHIRARRLLRQTSSRRP